MERCFNRLYGGIVKDVPLNDSERAFVLENRRSVRWFVQAISVRGLELFQGSNNRNPRVHRDGLL